MKSITENKDGLSKEMITEIIDAHYPILLAFDVAEGNMTLKEYLKKIKEFRKTRIEERQP